ncbi:MAG: twin-arginine translocation signal domain-containing protein, partial [Deltaproteobacteria bacterium]|nr:twin-arginine translocation signal domain-containing protein [Deltaproteobacteria bacterium]
MKKRNQSITRREFIKKTGVAGAAIGTAAMVPSFARKA